MLRTGDMARASSGRLMKICDISNDIALCLWFDGRGAIHEREYDIDALRPFWLSVGPRTLWPEVNQIPDEPFATTAALARKQRRAAAKRSKPSHKIKRSRSAQPAQ